MARRAAASAPVVALLLGVLLLPGATLPAAGQSGQSDAGAGEADPSVPQEERPLVVALGALPVALRSAIAEAEDHLLADVAQRQLDDTYAYVQGFQSLPPGDGALQDPALRVAYAWTGDVVEAFLAFPSTLSEVEAAGAACRTEGDTLGNAQVRDAVRSGLGGLRTLRSVRAELADRVAAAPERVDPAPVHESLEVLDAWLGDEGAAIEACLLLLAERHGVPTSFLTALVVPSTIHPTGRIRVFGSVGGADQVRLDAPSLGWSATLPVTQGGFRGAHTVPRGTDLRTHVLRLEAADQGLDLSVTVAKAPVTLVVDAPGRVAAGEPFLVAASVTAAPGQAEVARARLQVAWGQATSTHALAEGRAAVRLPAGDPGGRLLVVTYPGTDILESATATVRVEVVAAYALGDPGARLLQALPAPGVDLPEDLARLLPGWAWLLILVLLALAVALAIRALRRRRAARAAPTPAPATAFPGAASFAAGIGILVLALRRLGVVPAGRTVREWVREHRLSLHVADQFDRVRYGGEPEDARLTRNGLAWVERLWRRWVR